MSDDTFKMAGVACDAEVLGVGVPDGCGGCAPEVSVDAFKKAGVVCDAEVLEGSVREREGRGGEREKGRS